MDRDLILFDRKSKFVQSDSIYARYQDQMYYAYMFLEDIGLSIMPIGGRRSSDKPFSVSISPNDKQLKQKLNILFPSEWHTFDRLYSTLEQTTSGFIEDCAKRLLVRGTQYYEIVPASVNPQRATTEVSLESPLFVLLHIGGKILRIGSWYMQIIPRTIAREVGRRYVILPSKSVWKVSIPNQIGGTRQTKEMIEGLFIAGGKNKTISRIFNKYPNVEVNLDVSSYYRDAELFVASLTKKWGWDIRFSLQKYTLEYYQIYRRIQAAYTLAIFREELLKEMNLLLKRLGYECKLDMHGLLSSTEVSLLFDKLKRNEISFKELYDSTTVH